jgi:alpha-methylacyl-CoA racemase
MTGERVAVLAGVRVVELGGMGPGPFAGMMMADHGAEVTVLKRPDYVRRMYEGRSIFDRGKQSEVVDLKSEAGRARAPELVAGASDAARGSLWTSLPACAW